MNSADLNALVDSDDIEGIMSISDGKVREKTWDDRLERSVKVLDGWNSNAEHRAKIRLNKDVRMWLGKMGHETKPSYLRSLCYFLECVGFVDPAQLLDLKKFDDAKARFYPAERLVEWWIMLAKEKRLGQAKLVKTMVAVRSFFKHSRAGLVNISVGRYKPKPKPSLGAEELLRFREALSWPTHRILFDFLISVPVRDGQFQTCPHCNVDFYPKWHHIQSFPTIEPYSAFVITPEKGHASGRYKAELKQICFLTETLARELRDYKKFKEKALGRKLKPNEPIFTLTRNYRNKTMHETPLRKGAIKSLFFDTQRITGLRVYPHLMRSRANSVLAAQGIDKQLRDVYLGHSMHYEQGYVMHLIPLWRQTFMEKHALEALDVTSPTQHQVIELERELQTMKNKMLEDVEAVKFYKLMNDPLVKKLLLAMMSKDPALRKRLMEEGIL